MSPTPVQSAYIVQRLDHEFFLRATASVLDALEARVVPAVVLKGPVLAERIYDEPWTRSSSDIDVLVCPSDAVRAGAALAEIGYCPALDGLTPNENRRLEYNTPYRRSGWPSVEVHFRLTDTPGAALDSDAFVARRRPCRLPSGRVVFVLHPVDEFVFLCVHGARHHFEDPKWLLDLKLFARRYSDLPWQAVAARARELALETPVWVACRTLKKVLAFEIPGGGPGVVPNPLMRRAWPRIVPDFHSSECYKRLDWGIRDAIYEAALCDCTLSAALYLARRAYRFARREAHRRFSRRSGQSHGSDVGQGPGLPSPVRDARK